MCLQRSALERVAQLEDENAALKESAQRRSAVLQQSRSFITSYLEALTSLLSSPSHFSALIVLAMRLPVLAMALAVYYAWKENVNNIYPCMHAGNALLNDMVPAGASLMIGLHGLAEDSFSSHI